MGRAPCCSKVGLHRGPWTPNEDALLTKYVQENGGGNWRSMPKKAGLLRCGKSCRLRWMNYLRPDIKRGSIEPEEEELISRLHARLGNRWSLIAAFLPGRTDNGIKNYWNTHLSKKLKRQQMHQKDTSSHQLVDGQLTIKINNNHEESLQPPKKKKKKKRKSTVRNKPKMMMMQKGKMKMDQQNASSEFADLTADEEVASWSSDNGGINAPAEGDGKNSAYSSWTGFSTQSTVGMDESYHSSVPHQYPPKPTKDAMLEEVYQEYLQLLETDRKPDLQFDPIQEFVWA